MKDKRWYLGIIAAFALTAGCDGTTPPGTSSTSSSGSSGGEGGGGSGGGGNGGSAGAGGSGGAMAVCGDGAVSGTEVCDDGNTTSDDGCTADCEAIEMGWACANAGQACTPVFGDGMIVGMEACDDNNTADADGCSATGTIENGWACTGMPSVCTTTCGDGITAGTEVCDDNNTNDNDGCSATCASESGWTCTGMPSTCVTTCGDGVVAGLETCDDSNAASNDGCSDMCASESGWTCTGMPSACVTSCGDGVVAGMEACDDSNTTSNDGCSDMCTQETGWTCTGSPSTCATTCGDGIIAGAEACDDMNTMSSDGCSDMCAQESGWMCAGSPSACMTTCGDGIIAGTETCDDMNTANGDGCSNACAPENGWVCMGAPSACAATCGDGLIVGTEVCDDQNTTANDGCNATCSAIENGWSCTGAPSACTANCGDGLIVGTEACDDQNTTAGDGCNATCSAIENGWTCSGMPTACSENCGDGFLVGTEACDDSNTTAGDGCSASCAVEMGYGCSGQPSSCAAICGDDIKTPSEACDDGNTANGDCCSSACQPEPGCEIEVNDTTAQANNFATLSVMKKIKGFIDPTADKDFFLFTVPAGFNGNLIATTSTGPLGTPCATSGTPNNIDSFLTLYNAGGTSITTNDDFGGAYCSQIVRNALAAGNYFIEVKKSTLAPATATFDYTLELAITLTQCGDGTLDAGEQCDDGNTMAGDGCSATCTLEAAPEIEPNNTCAMANANGPSSVPPNRLLGGSINPAADTDWYAFTLSAYADVRIETFDSTGPGACVTGVDTVIQAFNSSCTALGPTDDDGSAFGNCSLLDPTLASQSFMRHLAPGTYYVQVTPYDSAAVFNYTVLISTPALCGNGIKEGSEQCDGGATCQADCLLIPVCGDGIKSGTEQCDDGNTTPGDGCSATCVLEGIAEVEPNGTTAEADVALPAITGSSRIIAAISPAAEQDTFKVTVATQQVVRFEIMDSNRDCVGMNATTLDLLTSAGAVFKTDASSSGINNCAAITANLDPGTYYIRAKASSAANTVPLYVLDIKYGTNNGVETEPNDTQATANPEAGTEFYVCADHQMNVDQDVYSITVPQGKSIRAEVVEVGTLASGYETCESLGLDSLIAFYSPTFTQLGTDDDAGRGYCSMVDGSGATPSNAYVHNLNAGTYYLAVRASTFSQSGVAGQFNYCLSVAIR